MNQNKLLLMTIIAAGIRANAHYMAEVREAAEKEDMDMQDVVATWTASQVDFLEKHAVNSK